MADEQTFLTDEQRAEFIRQQRAMLDWLEAHPKVPVHHYMANHMAMYPEWADEQRDKLLLTSPGHLARWMGKADKSAAGTRLSLSREFGRYASYRFHFDRAAMCEKRIVGHRDVVERRVTDEQRAEFLREELAKLEEEVVVAREPIIEYDCGSLLAKAR